MTPQTLRLLFAILYVVVDLIYVSLSSETYNAIVKNIQGYSIDPAVGDRIIVVIVTYIIMAFGWYVLSAGTANSWLHSYPPYLAGAMAGFVFGLTVYGTFNFTTRLMFRNYSWGILARDLMWGITWGTISTMLYAICLQYTSK
jgi:uncharacterized membrane protein